MSVKEVTYQRFQACTLIVSHFLQQSFALEIVIDLVLKHVELLFKVKVFFVLMRDCSCELQLNFVDLVEVVIRIFL